METPDSEAVAGKHASDSLAVRLSEVFGGFKAEWLRGHLYDYFTEPAYFPSLIGARPCVLIGGRGTGKTTVLRSMSYEGRAALDKDAGSKLRNWKYYGFYYRVNTNRVPAFDGPELSEAEWTRHFAHYLNLILCELVVGFLVWARKRDGEVDLSPEACRAVATAACIEPAGSLIELRDGLASALGAFQGYINNVVDAKRPALSMQAAPLDTLMQEVASLSVFRGKEFYFLIDEYENFLDYQQRAVNTLIKHSGDLYTFKIGVKELGWRVRSALNQDQILVSPADYDRVHIEESLEGRAFGEFARKVCNDRLGKLLGGAETRLTDIADVLPGIGIEEEAERLGVRQRVEECDAEIKKLSRANRVLIEKAPPLKAFFWLTWAAWQELQLADVVAEANAKPDAWDTRYDNYKYALLFLIKKRKVGRRKLYCGWEVYLLLANGNIRLLLQLVERALRLGLDLSPNELRPISVEMQTDGAQDIGQKNLAELEGIDVMGASIMKLVLGLGRVFQVMAGEPDKHAPEVNQFHLRIEADAGPQVLERAKKLLNAAVMHSALTRTPGNKLTSSRETSEYDYALHPVYSAFFVFSHRRKRKMGLRPEQVIGLVERPSDAIGGILGEHGRKDDKDFAGDQLRLFEAYYGRPS